MATRQGIKKFLDRYEETGTLERRPGSGRPSRITQAVRVEQMRSDDETTAVQLATLLNRRGYRFSLMTILQCRQTLGWTFRGNSYCQMIRNANKLKRLEWSRQYIHEAEAGFLDVVYTDETSIQMEGHRWFCCRKRGEPPRNKLRAKHPVKVHVWGGISLRGRTSVCVFYGMMDAEVYVDILDCCLLPFL